MRGGKASGVSGGGSVFRVRRIEDVALLVVQWALVLQVLLLILIAIQGYSFDSGLLHSQPEPLPGQDSYRIPIYQRLVQGMTTGFVALGLGGLLFYLRRHYLLRRQ